MVFRLALTGNIRKPSAVRLGFTKGTSFSTNSTTRTLPSGCREASKAVRGGNNSAEQIRPFLSATTFIMGLSHKREPFQGRFFFADTCGLTSLPIVNHYLSKRAANSAKVGATLIQ
jgi:hypothetical protein